MDLRDLLLGVAREAVESADPVVRVRTNLNASRPVLLRPGVPDALPRLPPKPRLPWEPAPPSGPLPPVAPEPEAIGPDLTTALLRTMQPELTIETAFGEEIVIAPWGSPTRDDGWLLGASAVGLSIGILGLARLVRPSIAATAGAIGFGGLLYVFRGPSGIPL